MRPFSLGLVSLVALVACAPVRVRVAADPQANLSGFRTFRILPVPERHGRTPSPSRNPMLNNSITNRALVRDLIEGFESRGYQLDENNPDFEVAYYASADEDLEVTYWDYGYPWRPWWLGPAVPVLTRYTRGTVLIDVIDPVHKALLWRGQGLARVSDDETRYQKELRKTVMAVLDKFPRASTRLAGR